MDIEYKLFYCRFCSEEKQYQDLLDLSKDEETMEEMVKAIIDLNIDYLDLKDKILPKTVCEKCYTIFVRAHKFFAKVKHNQDILKAIYSDIYVEIKEENHINDELRPSVQLSPQTEILKFERPKKFQMDINTQSPINTCELKEINIEFKEETKNNNLIVCDSSVSDAPVCESPQKSIKDKHLLDDDDINCNNDNDESSSNSEDSDDKLVKIDKRTSTWKHKKRHMKYDMQDFLSYAGIPIFNDDELKSADSEPSDTDSDTDLRIPKMQVKGNDRSWTSYKWYCYHCKEKFKSMIDLRSHSKIVHDYCFGFSCADCNCVLNTFNSFVEHVREHRNGLRLYCQYCNRKFRSRAECETHSFEHWHIDKICELCGELLPDQDSYTRHTKLYKRIGLPKTVRRQRPELVREEDDKTWIDYEWTCQDCHMRHPNANSLRSHVQKVHNKCFAMKCMDCLRVIDNYRRFVNHVHVHRPYLKNYCQFCNAHIDDKVAMKQHLNGHETGEQRPCHGCGQIFKDNAEMSRHMKEYNAHRCVRILTSEDLTCHQCHKVFKSIGNLKLHMKLHSDVAAPVHMCHLCGKHFQAPSGLKHHMESHNSKTHVCYICDKSFSSLLGLKKHVNTHSTDRPFTCNDCGKSYRLKEQLRRHIIVHSEVNPYKCTFCEKQFKFSSNWKNHERQHTGARPYECKVCDKTFSNYSNCDKHMKRKHGMTISKYKNTDHGKMEINQQTGEIKSMVTNKETQKWLDDLMKSKKRSGRRKKAVN